MQMLKWGLVGGGEGSQIGFTHRAGAELDRAFELVSGAFDINPERSHRFGIQLGLDRERVFGTWEEMLEIESARSERLDLVTVATPNATHFAITKAFLEAGFNVLCEKPLTTDLESARELVEIARKSRRICAVNFGYTGYPMVRQIKAMIENGELGAVRLVKVEFAGGFFADASDLDNPRIRWRFDPELAGTSCVMADVGSHAMHLATHVVGRKIHSLSADFAYGVEGRQLEDDAQVAFRMEGGVIGRLWVSGLAVGRIHGLTLQVYGEKGGLNWVQEYPEQLEWTPLGKPSRILERGSVHLLPEVQNLSRITVGHPEGILLAFANIYRELANVLNNLSEFMSVNEAKPVYPTVDKGCHIVEVVDASVQSAKESGQWNIITGY